MFAIQKGTSRFKHSLFFMRKKVSTHQLSRLYDGENSLNRVTVRSSFKVNVLYQTPVRKMTVVLGNRHNVAIPTQ